MIKAIIFDFDGVVIESEQLLEEIEIEIFNNHSVPLTKEINGQYLGYKINDYIAAMENRFKTKLDHGEIVAELHKGFEKIYTDIALEVKGLRSSLDNLQGKYKLALATSREKHLVAAACERLNLQEYFQGGAYKEDVTKGKPDPEVFIKAAAIIGVEPKECVVVEDAKSGIQAAKAAGMQVVARKAQHNQFQDFSMANFVITDMNELPKLIDTL